MMKFHLRRVCVLVLVLIAIAELAVMVLNQFTEPRNIRAKGVNKLQVFQRLPSEGATLPVASAKKELVHGIVSSFSKSGTKDVRFAKKETIKYPEFEITEPHFASEELRNRFRKDPTNLEYYGIPSAEKLVGMNYVVRNGTFSLPYDCGYRSDVEFVLRQRQVPPSKWFRSLAPLIIPDGWTFQHFMDGMLPKVIQALSYLQMPQVTLLMKPPRDKILWEILAKLNITKNKIELYTSGNYGADYMIFACNTPPLHPLLWQKARALLGSPTTLQVPWEEAHVVLVTRTGCFNCGRRFTNIDDVVNLLNKRYGNSTVKLFKGPYSLEETIELFGKAKLVIGAHGGGMVNVVFSPSDTHVVEMMPTEMSGRRFMMGADKMIWIQSVLMGQTFWRLPLEPLNAKGDMLVDLQELSRILDGIKPK